MNPSSCYSFEDSTHEFASGSKLSLDKTLEEDGLKFELEQDSPMEVEDWG
jgi:hypothetical protein